LNTQAHCQCFVAVLYMVLVVDHLIMLVNTI
jgi:hypothetical protein